MSDFAQIRYLTARGWEIIDNQYFYLAGRTERPVDLPMASFIQRQMDKLILPKEARGAVGQFQTA